MDPLDVIEAAVPGVSWAKFAGWAFGVIGLVAVGAGLGWQANDAFDGTKAAKAETHAAQTVAACETGRADSNAAAAGDLSKNQQRAAGADRNSTSTSQARSKGYAAAQQEASNVPHLPAVPACIDPEPLRQLFIGMQHADAAAAAARNESGGGAPGSALDRLPAAGGDPQ